MIYNQLWNLAVLIGAPYLINQIDVKNFWSYNDSSDYTRCLKSC